MSTKTKLSGRAVLFAVLFLVPVFALGQKTLPVLSSISPISTTAGVGVTLTVNGSNFSTGSIVLWNGVSQPTTYISSVKLTATIASALVGAAGTANVSVYTAGRNGGTSGALGFIISPATTTPPPPTPLAITTTSIPIGTTGTAYSATLAASGGTAPYAWSVGGGSALPPGLTLSAAGALSGTPTTSGSYSFIASVKDAASSTQSYTYSTSIAQGSTTTTGISVTSLSPSTAAAGGPAFALTINGTGFVSGTSVYFGSANITSSTTYVSPTQLTATISNSLIASAGTASVRVWTSAGGTSNSISFTIGAGTTTTTTSTPVAITTTSIPAGTTGTAYSATLAASGGTTPYAWSIGSGALPPGLTLSAAGALSGTPTTSGSYSFTASVKDAASSTQSYTYSTSIAQGANPLSISTASVPNGTSGTAYPATTLAATGGTLPYTWTVATGSTIPAGLALSTTGGISGTPTTAGTYSFSVQVKDSANNIITKAYSVTLAAATTTTTTTTLTCNSAFGNCSDPYEGAGGPPATRTAISACGTYTPTANQYFLVSQNLGTDPSVVCVLMNYGAASGWTLDLGGFAVTGGVQVHTNVAGVKIFNGSITCSIPDPTNCLVVDYPIGVLASQFRIHHLNISQTNNTTAQARCIFVNGWGPTGVYGGGGSGNGKEMRIDHISIISRPSVAAGVYRSPLISVVASGTASVGGNFEVDHNYLYCQALTQQCHAVSLWATSNALVDNNLVIMDKNASNGGIGRFVLNEGNTTPSSGLEIAYNDVTVNDQIAARIWGSTTGQFPGVYIHDNIFRHIIIGNRYGAISLGQNGVNLENFVNAQISNNSFEMMGGNGVDVIEASNVFISNNTVSCGGQPCIPGYYLARTDVGDSLTPIGTGMSVSNNDVSALTAAGLPGVMVCQSPTPAGGSTAYTCGYSATATLGSTATVCNSGTAVGNGPINAASVCQ